MTTYTYKCQECGHKFEAVQKMCDEPLKDCPLCEGEINKVPTAAPFKIKGVGNYGDGRR